MSLLGHVKNRLKAFADDLSLSRSSRIESWNERARSLQARAVFNAGHSEAELLEVTAMQKSEMYPRLRDALNGDEQVALDLGCGTGRFSADLAEMISGHVIAVDPVPGLLALAPRHDRVEYRQMETGKIPVKSASIDLVWICLVLGGIRGRALRATLREVERVLSPGGLVFLVENTTTGTGNWLWSFRSIEEYLTILPFVSLSHVGDYSDLGERMSIFSGRSTRSR